MSDLGAFVAEHATVFVSLMVGLTALVRARAARVEAAALSETAAARAVAAVVTELEEARSERDSCEDRCAALEKRMSKAEERATAADKRAAKAEEMSAALARELEDLMRAVGAAGKD